MKKETSEVLKSALIGVLALVALVCWLKFQPRLPDVKPKEKIGRKLFEHFDDPGKMTRVEFTRIDPKTGEPQQLVLVRDGEEWRLPGLSNFPAENAEQVAKVVAPLMQLTVLDVVDETVNKKDSAQTERFHFECGLANPLDSNGYLGSDSFVDASQERSDSSETPEKSLNQGYALAVKIDGENGEKLVNLLIGARVPESAATRDNRFVRFPDDDVVYSVDFSGESTQEDGSVEFKEFPERVSFDPKDWIDQDLLRISRWDVVSLAAYDYSFSLKKTENGFEQANTQQNGVAVFKQNPDNSLSRVWSLARVLKLGADGAWQDASSINPESADNDVLNATADVLGALKVVEVRKKPSALSAIFRDGRMGSELIAQSESLGELGFSFFDVDPLEPDKIVPTLVGEGGTVELKMKEGVKIVLVFGLKFEDKRVCLAQASFDRKILEENAEDETEVAFLESDGEKKAKLKNNRFADWFYLISEEEYQKIHFRMSETVKEK